MKPEGRQKLRHLLIQHEGMKLRPYTDTTGHITIGVGRNLTDRDISVDEALYLLNNDVNYFVSKLSYLLPFYNELDENRQIALVDMCFNLGLHGFLGFKDMLLALAQKDFAAAAQAMLDSKWAGQVGERARCLAEIVRSGEME